MDDVKGNPRKVMLRLPEGFDPALLCEIQDKDGVKIPDAEMSDREASLLKFPCHVLAKIANGLYSFYHQPSRRNLVEVPFQLDDLKVSYDAEEEEDEGPFHHLVQIGADQERVLRRLRRWGGHQVPGQSSEVAVRRKRPMAEHIGLPVAREVLEKIGARSVRWMKVFDTVAYDDVLDLINTYDVKNVQLVGFELRYTADQTRALLRKPLDSLMIPHAPSNLLYDTTIRWLQVNEPPVSLDDLPTIIRKFLTSTTVARWSFGDSRIEATDLLSCFAEHPLFHISYTCPLPQQRPLIAFYLNGEYATVFILRADERVVGINSSMHFEVMAPSDVPAIFAPL